MLTVLQNVDEKRLSENTVIATVEAVLKDSTWLGEKIVEKLKIGAAGAGDTCDGPVPVDGLSSRQAEVLALMAQGLADADIATCFGISKNTVRNMSAPSTLRSCSITGAKRLSERGTKVLLNNYIFSLSAL